MNRNKTLVLSAVGVLTGSALLLAGWYGNMIIWGACVPPSNFTGVCGSPEPWLTTYSGLFFVVGIAVMAASVVGAVYSLRGMKA